MNLLMLFIIREIKNAKKREIDENSHPLVSPKRWADAGVGIGIGWAGVIPLIEAKNKTQMF